MWTLAGASERGVVAADVGIPVGERTARVVAEVPKVERPDPEGLVAMKRLPEELRRILAGPRAEGNDVLYRHQSELAVLTRLVEQELGLEHVHGAVDEGRVPIVVAHTAELRVDEAAGDLRTPPRGNRRFESVEGCGEGADLSDLPLGLSGHGSGLAGSRVSRDVVRARRRRRDRILTGGGQRDG